MSVRSGLACVVLVWALGGCTKPNDSYCASDSECADADKPFCDVNGEFAESDYHSHVCSERPDGCSIERCGCTPGEALSCSADQLTLCADDGRSTTSSACALGCAENETRCATFEPSNGLGPALAESASLDDAVIPAGSVIDTTQGTIQLPSNQTYNVSSRLVTSGGEMIRVFVAKSFAFQGARIVGTYPFAAVASGAIVVSGRLDATADNVTPGPGAQTAATSCKGSSGSFKDCSGRDCGTGGGGGGNGTGGGQGGYRGPSYVAGGNSVTAFVPLAGGCPGGDHVGQNKVVQRGGAGGGAIQLVSASAIRLTGTGFLDVGGGGGPVGCGGGAGGTVVLEAPSINVDGVAAGIASNGGAGAGCSTAGPDGPPTASPALAVTATGCRSFGGNGGSFDVPARNANQCSGTCFDDFLIGGGGGGSVGKALFRTRSGSVSQTGSPVMSILATNEMLTIR